MNQLDTEGMVIDRPTNSPLTPAQIADFLKEGYEYSFSEMQPFPSSDITVPTIRYIFRKKAKGN